MGQSNFLLLQNVFKFCYSYFFLVCSVCVFCCGGVGQWVEASALFGCCWLVLFSFAVFISYRKSKCFYSSVAVFGGQFAFVLFLQTVFKFIPNCAVRAFCCGSFWWTVLVYFVSATFVLGHGNSFYANIFYIFKLHSFFNSWRSVFYLLQFYGCRQHLTWGLASVGLDVGNFGYSPLSAVVWADGFQFDFLLLSSTFNY